MHTCTRIRVQTRFYTNIWSTRRATNKNFLKIKQREAKRNGKQAGKTTKAKIQNDVLCDGNKEQWRKRRKKKLNNRNTKTGLNRTFNGLSERP